MNNRNVFLPVMESGDREFIFDMPGSYLVFMNNISGHMRFVIAEEHVTLNICGLYSGSGSEAYSLSTTQLHARPSSTSDLFIKGIFRDRSRFLYDGLIRIEKEGNGSHAYQKNQNLILSDDVFVSSRPDLEILAQDVFCTHGSTTGRPNEKELYYLQTRGIEREKGIELLAAGFAQDLYRRIEEAGFGKEISRYKKLFSTTYA